MHPQTCSYHPTFHLCLAWRPGRRLFPIFYGAVQKLSDMHIKENSTGARLGEERKTLLRPECVALVGVLKERETMRFPNPSASLTIWI